MVLNEKDLDMRKAIVFFVLPICLLLNGCTYVDNYLFNKKYHGKTFKIRTQFYEGDKAKIETWEKANDLSYDKEERIYNFYVNGKLVTLDVRESVVIEEQ